ncbi:UNVERIFIED_ORG: hypothetical protein J2740_004568 [Rhizobium nepotum]|nr:hypothetical protein [Rhizobium nepotum]
MKKRFVKNFVVEIRKRRGRRPKSNEAGPIARATEKLRAQTPLQLSR